MAAAALLDQRIELQRQDESRGATFADAQRAWVHFATVWAAVEPLAGREFFRNLEGGAEVDLRVRLRRIAGLTEKMRVVHRGRIYEIVAPPIDVRSRGVEVELMCREYRSG